MVQPNVLHHKKLRVLIADDIQETRRNTRLMCSMIDGVEVVAIASNGAQAVELAREHNPDIVLLDINMPELNGLAAYKRISQVNPAIACIIISAEKDLGTMRAAMSIGIQQYLTKPFTADELETAIIHVSEYLEKVQKPVLPGSQPQVRNVGNLRQLAEEYVKTKRTDDRAIQVFEELVKLPDCEFRWIQTLAMIYILRNKWGRLKALAEYVEKRFRQ